MEHTICGIYNDTNKTIRVVYVCAFVGKLNSNARCLKLKQSKKQKTNRFSFL
jgi:hypothetical protein